MAAATLEIKISDSGENFVGRPAPSAPGGAGQSVSAPSAAKQDAGKMPRGAVRRERKAGVERGHRGFSANPEGLREITTLTEAARELAGLGGFGRVLDGAQKLARGLDETGRVLFDVRRRASEPPDLHSSAARASEPPDLHSSAARASEPPDLHSPAPRASEPPDLHSPAPRASDPPNWSRAPGPPASIPPAPPVARSATNAQAAEGAPGAAEVGEAASAAAEGAEIAAGATEAVGAIAGLSAAAGPAGLAVAGVAIAGGFAISKLTEFGNSLQAEAQRLAQYSAALSVQQGVNELRDTATSMRMADSLGADLADFSDDFNRLANILREIGGAGVKEILAIKQLLQPFIDSALRALEIITDGVVIGADGMKIVADFCAGDLLKARADAAQAMKDIARLLSDLAGENEDKLKQEVDPFISDFFRPFVGADPNAPLNEPLHGPRRRGLGVG